MTQDAIGDRMKGHYEDRTRFLLPRRTHTIVRVDGKAFHTLTRHCERPWDFAFARAMWEVGIALCRELQGAKFGYVQSDEVSVLLTDYDSINTDAWFSGNLQKIVSVAASIATETFNRSWPAARAHFDARAFTIPEPEEVVNYFIWRQQDATRNSIQMGADALYSAKELHGKNTSQMQEMMHAKGINWNNYDAAFKRGVAIVRYERAVDGVIRHEWAPDVEVPIFTQDRKYILCRLPSCAREGNK